MSHDRPDFNEYIEHIKTMPREHLEVLVVILAGTSANSLHQYKEIIEIINNFN